VLRLKIVRDYELFARLPFVGFVVPTMLLIQQRPNLGLLLFKQGASFMQKFLDR